MFEPLNTLSSWLGLLPSGSTEPAQLEQLPLTMRRIDDEDSPDFDALAQFIRNNPTYLRQTQHRKPTYDDAVAVLHELPPGAKPAQKYLWGIWWGDSMVGYLEVIRHWPRHHHLYIGQLMIGERWHRRGYGRAVLAMLADRARAWQGIRRWRLAVVASQTSSIDFWRAMSFVDTGTRESLPGYKAALVVMERTVAG